MELRNILEALLLVAGEPVQPAALARAMGAPVGAVEKALGELADECRRRGAGTRIARSSEGAQLVTAPETHAAVERFITVGIREKLTPAAAETLAIIAYRGPVTRAAIEAIRGVNSSFTLRLLSLRGLATAMVHPVDARRFVYEVSAEFLRQLGVASPDELPHYAELRQHAGMTKLAEGAEAAFGTRSPGTGGQSS